ncbi:hypothetical protein HDU91_007101, partial [Kappamyces sp. JEL0680]
MTWYSLSTDASCSLLRHHSPPIQRRIDLIEATHQLLTVHRLRNDDGERLAPIQIRLEKDKPQLLRRLLLQHPILYKKRNVLMELAVKLVEPDDAYGLDHLALVHILLAEAALHSKDPEECSLLCFGLLEGSRSLPKDRLVDRLWPVLLTLCSHASALDQNKKFSLLCHAALASSATMSRTVLRLLRSVKSTLPLVKFPDICGQDPETAFAMLEKMRGCYSVSTDLAASLGAAHHDFYQSPGAPTSSFYTERGYFLEGLELDSNYSCLLAENALRRVGGLDASQKNIHALQMARELVGKDAALAVSYLLST